jgi:hypothetical protein
MDITWKTIQCDRLTSDGFIVTAHRTATAVDGEYAASVYSTCSFPPGDTTLPYKEVTEQDVLRWCWGGGVDKDATEAALAEQINAQKKPVIEPGLPWATA